MRADLLGYLTVSRNYVSGRRSALCVSEGGNICTEAGHVRSYWENGIRGISGGKNVALPIGLASSEPEHRRRAWRFCGH